MTDDETILTELRARAAAGATFLELLDFVHEEECVKPYDRGLVLMRFHMAFSLHPSDFDRMIFRCKVFGDGAKVSVEATEKLFRERLDELSARWMPKGD